MACMYAKDCKNNVRRSINAVENSNQNRASFQNNMQGLNNKIGGKRPFNKAMITCWNCGRKGHFQRECQERNERRNNYQQAEN